MTVTSNSPVACDRRLACDRARRAVAGRGGRAGVGSEGRGRVKRDRLLIVVGFGVFGFIIGASWSRSMSVGETALVALSLMMGLIGLHLEERAK